MPKGHQIAHPLTHHHHSLVAQDRSHCHKCNDTAAITDQQDVLHNTQDRSNCRLKYLGYFVDRSDQTRLGRRPRPWWILYEWVVEDAWNLSQTQPGHWNAINVSTVFTCTPRVCETRVNMTRIMWARAAKAKFCIKHGLAKLADGTCGFHYCCIVFTNGCQYPRYRKWPMQ